MKRCNSPFTGARVPKSSHGSGGAPPPALPDPFYLGERMEAILVAILGPAVGAIFGAIAGKFASNGALKKCVEARKVCNDKVHALETAMTVAQARTAGLEGELDRRIRPLEEKNNTDNL